MALSRQIYKDLYQGRVRGRERARILPYLHLEEIVDREDGLTARFRDLLHGRELALEADGLILCTGYTWRKEHPLLAELAPWLEREPGEGYRILRDYRVASDAAFGPGIFLQGFAEATHGARETVLALLPILPADIL